MARKEKRELKAQRRAERKAGGGDSSQEDSFLDTPLEDGAPATEADVQAGNDGSA